MNKENRKNKERERVSNEGEEETQLGEICLLEFNSSVEVGYGFYAIRSKLLTTTDMYWVVL